MTRCWFCDGRDTAGRFAKRPDRGPVCDACRAQLDGLLNWLVSRGARDPRVGGPAS